MAFNLSNRQSTVSVVVPARNEARNIGFVLENLPVGIDEVILVDGNSQDDTIAAAKRARPDVQVLSQARRGKGNALSAGFGAAAGDYIIMIDADGSMHPGEIPRFVKALDDGAQYAKGTRFAFGGGSDDISPLRDVGNRCLNGYANVLFRTRHTDLCYGYNGFRRECLVAFDLPDPYDTSTGSLWGDGFEIETLMNVRASKARLAITEVPSFEHPRRSGESNLRTFRDGSRVLATITKERMKRAAKSAPLQVAADPGWPGWAAGWDPSRPEPESA